MKQFQSTFQAFLTILCADICLIWFFMPQLIFFSYVEEGLPGLNQYLVRILVLLKDTAKWRRSGSNP